MREREKALESFTVEYLSGGQTQEDCSETIMSRTSREKKGGFLMTGGRGGVDVVIIE